MTNSKIVNALGSILFECVKKGYTVKFSHIKRENSLLCSITYYGENDAADVLVDVWSDGSAFSQTEGRTIINTVAELRKALKLRKVVTKKEVL